MGEEATIVDVIGNGGDPVEYTCLDNTSIAKGTLMELEDPRTVKKISAVDKPLVGIAAHEKVADDGATTISVITNAIVRVKVKGGGNAATIGDHVSAASDLNTVEVSLTLDIEKGWDLGMSLENGAAGDTILVRMLK